MRINIVGREKERKRSQEKGILIDRIKECTAHRRPASLPLRFRYHSESSSASIHWKMERRKARLRKLYSWPRLVDENVPLDLTIEDVCDGGSLRITGWSIANFIHGVGNNVESFVQRTGKTVSALLD